MSDKTERMRALRDEVLALGGIPLVAYRIKQGAYPVIGEGDHNADLMFVGEAPGRNEAKEGRPFCGAAGKILDELLRSIEIVRTHVYITNIVKDRPPENRDPLPSEIEVYGPFLDKQITIIEPKVIAPLGRYAMQYIMRKFDLEFDIEPISTAHGKVYEATSPFGTIRIAPQYHPAAAIYNHGLIDTLKTDFQTLKQLL